MCNTFVYEVNIVRKNPPMTDLTLIFDLQEPIIKGSKTRCFDPLMYLITN